MYYNYDVEIDNMPFRRSYEDHKRAVDVLKNGYSEQTENEYEVPSFVFDMADDNEIII